MPLYLYKVVEVDPQENMTDIGTIAKFIKRVFTHVGLALESILIMLIYIERLMVSQITTDTFEP